ncbi:Eukaryotic elongation factor 2 kinase [Trema orientale]|uniref:Eukaryotic elongation factor 2 kinase n=1 Tax=Trema orientale TaxID=63057 RepID=A0A2P5EQ03_TREOI|nr:Eukaryotic elongation factor 2 kinase [Trema orientale]
MMRHFFTKAQRGCINAGLLLFNQKREVHSRNKKAMEFIAKGYNALTEVDRVIDYAELQDKRLIPLLRTAKENFELALEADNSNTHARYWLSKLHMKYHVPGACKAVGAALLVEAADMGDKDAQYELGCKLRVENPYVHSDQQAFYYLEKAAEQFHPGALYLLGVVYLTGDCVKKDMESALWCFHKASEKGHAGAAVAYGCLLLKGVEVPESIAKLSSRRVSLSRRARKDEDSHPMTRVEIAREKFEIAARAGCDLALRWLETLDREGKQLEGLEEEEKQLLTQVGFTWDSHDANRQQSTVRKRKAMLKSQVKRRALMAP